MGFLFAPGLPVKSMSIQQRQSASASNHVQEVSDSGGRPGAARVVRALGADFKPNEFTVLCGRGSLYSEASGNTYLKHIILQSVPVYANTPSRSGKSAIVSTILQAMHAVSPNAAFVKFEDGQWREVDDATAREKIGTIFRDLLHEKYRSSNKAKVARRSLRRTLGKHDNAPGNELLVVEPRNATDMDVERLSFPLRLAHADESEDSLSSISLGAIPQQPSSLLVVPPVKMVSQQDQRHKSIEADDTAMSWNASLSFFQQVDGASLPTASTLVDCDVFGDEDDDVHATIRIRGKPVGHVYAGRGWTRLDS